MKRLIVNADDLGYDPSVTRGILEAMRQGVVSSATLMVNTPHAKAAADAAAGLSLGLHLNLARHAPLWEGLPAALLVCGELHEPNAAALPADAVRQETAAQVERFEALCGRRPTHLDVHKHLHRHPNVRQGLLEAARALGLPVRALDGPMREQLRGLGVRCTDAFVGEAGAEAYWTWPRFEAAIAALGEGVTELMCHPGYAPTTLRSGYAAQREVELATFLRPEARELLARHGVALCDFAVLR